MLAAVAVSALPFANAAPAKSAQAASTEKGVNKASASKSDSAASCHTARSKKRDEAESARSEFAG